MSEKTEDIIGEVTAAAMEGVKAEKEEVVADATVEGDTANVQDVDTELEAMKQRLQQMEAESLTLKPNESADASAKASVEATAEEVKDEAVLAVATAAARAAVQEVNGGLVTAMTVDEAVADADSRSIYVGNVDYSATGDEIGSFFSECGTINRVTIMAHKPSGQPKGFAYVEFKDVQAVENAMILNESMFKGRQLKIIPKRTNVPGVSARGTRGRGRYGRGRGYYYGRRPRGRGRRGRWVPY